MNWIVLLSFLVIGVVLAAVLSVKWPKVWAWLVAALVTAAGYAAVAWEHVSGINLGG